MNADCHFGDHEYQTNGWCKYCDKFNGAWLSYQRYKKAEREGRIHGLHFHKTKEALARCKRTDEEDEEPPF